MRVVNRILGEAMTPERPEIYRSPEKAYLWSEKTKKRFYEAEKYIIRDPYWAYRYARDIIQGRWPEAESGIAKVHDYAYLYARDVIKGRWPEAEANFMRTPYESYRYAKNVIKGRWPEAEATIANSAFKVDYLTAFPEAKEDWVLNGWIDWLDT